MISEQLGVQELLGRGSRFYKQGHSVVRKKKKRA